jgi:surfeit locus 1 family protein
VVLAILVALGVWQLERRHWKEGLIRQIEARAYGAPGAVVAEQAWPDWRASEDEFSRVRLSGTFLHDKEVLLNGLMPAQRGAPVQGFNVFTPLRLASGAIVMVNRGFVPTERREPSSRAEAQIPGEVAVTGLVRAPESRAPFVPENEPGRERWFVRDPAAMAAARGLERAAPFYVDADDSPNPGGWPRGGQTRLALPNNHLQYALTWFGIAGALLAVFAAFARRRLADPKAREGPEAPDP